MSYVIQNCPAILRMTKVCDAYETTRDLPQLCKDCTDCVMKQIVELCKEQKVINCNIDGKEQVLKAYYHTHLGDKILELLDIQAVE